MRKFLFIGMLLLSFNASAEHEEIVEVLKYVETLNDPNAVGDGGDSWGVLQIQEGVIKDVNRYFGTHYQHWDVFDPVCAQKITILYMRMGAERYERLYGIKASEEVLVRNHNGGIYQGHRINATKKYYTEYLKWKTRLEKT
jgi:hypothetical protein